jgi:DNA-binding cell septation regulator SpoVG
VRVDWVDALFELDGNGSPPDSFDVETYGWIVGQNQTFVTVAGERLPDGQYRALTHIPQILIQHIQDLYEGSA